MTDSDKKTIGITNDETRTKLSQQHHIPTAKGENRASQSEIKDSACYYTAAVDNILATSITVTKFNMAKLGPNQNIFKKLHVAIS